MHLFGLLLSGCCSYLLAPPRGAIVQFMTGGDHQESTARASVAMANKRVRTIIERAERMQLDGTGKYDDVYFGDDDIEKELFKIAVLREPTLDDLDKVIAKVEADDRERTRKYAAFYQACSARSDDLRVCYVYNTADRRIIVLAKNAACACMFARYARHIKDDANGRVLILKPEKEAELRKSGSALGRALRDGNPGVVQELGDNVVMKGSQRVYTPMTVVGDD